MTTTTDTDAPGLTILHALLLAPLVGITLDDTTRMHRVEIEGLPFTTWETADHATAVCGTPVKLLVARWHDLRTRRTNLRRCPTCRTWSRTDA